MRIDFAHVHAKSAFGGPIDFAVFESCSADHTDSGNARILAELTGKARLAGHNIGQSSLAYMDHGRVKPYGSKRLAEHLAGVGLLRWTHSIDV